MSANSLVQISNGISINSTSMDANSALFYMLGGCDVDVGDLSGYSYSISATYLARSVAEGRNHVGLSKQSSVTTSSIKFLADASKMLVESTPVDAVVQNLNGGSAVRV